MSKIVDGILRDVKSIPAKLGKSLKTTDVRKKLLLNLPYIITGYVADKIAWLYRITEGDMAAKLTVMFGNMGKAFRNPLPSMNLRDLIIGIAVGVGFKVFMVQKSKKARKFRQGYEYGSARWGSKDDIEPYMDPVFKNNILLTQTERLQLKGFPSAPKYARNKNVLVIGGSGSGKTRFFCKPNLMQLHSSYIMTDPKGTCLIEVGRMFEKHDYKIKVFNTINFSKSMHYNPFAYIHSEKDILHNGH